MRELTQPEIRQVSGGVLPFLIGAAGWGAAMGGASYIATAPGDSFSWGHFGISVGVGALAGGITAPAAVPIASAARFVSIAPRHWRVGARTASRGLPGVGMGSGVIFGGNAMMSPMGSCMVGGMGSGGGSW